jgi:hypothetical protein
MKNQLRYLIKQMNEDRLLSSDIINWAAPVISFGNVENSKIATLGINPSNREFVDLNNVELNDNERRFYTLNSLNLKNWSSIQDNQLEKIISSCNDYFVSNPYDGWFKQLDFIISGSSMSYYFPSREACHLDLVPYATHSKWSNLSSNQKAILLDESIDILGEILKASSIKVIILNGKTVVDNLQKISKTNLEIEHIKDWTLPRNNTENVKGFSYSGYISKIGNINLNKKIKILGFNHNIQSSFGVTTEVKKSIRDWITKKITYEN